LIRHSINCPFRVAPGQSSRFNVAGYQPFRIASWFESTNSMLRGKRPREVLASDPAVVVAAAKDHIVGAVHG
jgi:hypothetical protein